MQGIIRTYQDTDAQVLIELLRLNIPQYFAPQEEADLVEYLDNKIEQYYVITVADKVVGAGGINFSADKTIALISWDFLHPLYQGKGLGAQLLKHRITVLKGITSVEKIAVRTSQFAFQFYEKQGFKLLGTEKDYWAPGYDLYSMVYPSNWRSL